MSRAVAPFDLICQRVQCSAFLLDFWRRAVHERKRDQARIILDYRVRLLQAMRQRKGYDY